MFRVLEAMRNGEPVRRVAAVVALQEFLRAPEQLRRRFRSQLREMVTVGDFPSEANIRAYVDRFLITPGEMDTGYEMIFKVHDEAMAEMQLKKSSFKLLNIKAE